MTKGWRMTEIVGVVQWCNSLMSRESTLEVFREGGWRNGPKIAIRSKENFQAQ